MDTGKETWCIWRENERWGLNAGDSSYMGAKTTTDADPSLDFRDEIKDDDSDTRNKK